MEQTALFPDTLPYQPHSATSRDAAEAARPSAETGRARVLALLSRSLVGLTDEEISTALGMNANTERPRRRELELARLVRAAAQQRRTRSGRFAQVWCAV
jgi:hypothetical protein